MVLESIRESRWDPPGSRHSPQSDRRLSDWRGSSRYRTEAPSAPRPPARTSAPARPVRRIRSQILGWEVIWWKLHMMFQGSNSSIIHPIHIVRQCFSFKWMYRLNMMMTIVRNYLEEYLDIVTRCQLLRDDHNSFQRIHLSILHQQFPPNYHVKTVSRDFN